MTVFEPIEDINADSSDLLFIEFVLLVQDILFSETTRIMSSDKPDNRLYRTETQVPVPSNDNSNKKPRI